MDNQNFKHMELLANDINEELQRNNNDNYINKKNSNNKNTNNIDIDNINNKNINKLKEEYHEETNTVPTTICEPILLLSIYFILSQKNVQFALQRYLTILKPNENGDFKQLSIIIYGLILTLFFYSMKNLLEL